MNQTELERAVCRATGESREVVRRVGFQLLPMPRIVLLPRVPPFKHTRPHKLVAAGNNPASVAS
jgi:hypothetical protein